MAARPGLFVSKNKILNSEEGSPRSKWKIVGYFLILCLLIGNILQYQIKTNVYTSEKSKNPYKFLDPYRYSLDDKDVITNIQATREYLREIIAEEKDVEMSLYFEMLNTGANISINPDTRIYPASLVKLPVALAAVKKVESGGWNWTNELVFLPEDHDKRSGQLFNNPIGTRFTIERLVEEALVNSDNTAFLMLNRNLTDGDLDKVIEATGLYDLTDQEGRFSAKEYTRLMRSLYVSSFLHPDNSERILEYLSSATFDQYLSQGIPEGVRFAHKYGENIEENIFSDSGIVYVPNRPYMITVMIKSDQKNVAEAREHAKSLFKKISQRIYEDISKN